VLRVLGNLLDLERFDYNSSEEVLAEVRRALEASVPAAAPAPAGSAHAVRLEAGADGEGGLVDLPMYQTDALVRRAPSLQRTREGRTAAAIY
jgi:NADH-quinone oxidoreductase subunit G